MWYTYKQLKRNNWGESKNLARSAKQQAQDKYTVCHKCGHKLIVNGCMESQPNRRCRNWWLRDGRNGIWANGFFI